jgi:hypothetical protein
MSWIVYRKPGNGLKCAVPTPGGFEKLFTLKVVKALCFHTLLQVLILKLVSGNERVQKRRNASGSWRGAA